MPMRQQANENLNYQLKTVNQKSSGGGSQGIIIMVLALWILLPAVLNAGQDLYCFKKITSKDALLIADHNGRVLYKKNEAIKFIPASTLKLLTALSAIHSLGPSYKYLTEFYMDSGQNLKIKGYGDPLLISEVWKEIADELKNNIKEFNDLILDDTYFSRQINIPGRNNSTNPYDAPVGALCANFNTVFFDRDKQGRIIPAEPQTPIIPFARKKIRALGLKKGRYTFSHDPHDAARYAGELLLHFLKQKNVQSHGKIRPGMVKPEDRLILAYRSRFTLEQTLMKMLEFSSNFMANQVLVSTGAHIYGPPGTLNKGIRMMTGYAREELYLKNIIIVEGSGLSRENRLSALDMLTILRRFEPFRHLLTKKDNMFFKTGSLKGISTRVGYIEGTRRGTIAFVIFLNRSGPDIDRLMECIRHSIADEG